MTSISSDDARAYGKWLTMACQEAGLSAEQYGDEVIVHAPGTSHFLAETIRIAPGEDGGLQWWWSWGKPFCPADDVATAVRVIKHVVSVPTS